MPNNAHEQLIAANIPSDILRIAFVPTDGAGCIVQFSADALTITAYFESGLQYQTRIPCASLSADCSLPLVISFNSSALVRILRPTFLGFCPKNEFAVIRVSRFLKKDSLEFHVELEDRKLSFTVTSAIAPQLFEPVEELQMNRESLLTALGCTLSIATDSSVRQCIIHFYGGRSWTRNERSLSIFRVVETPELPIEFAITRSVANDLQSILKSWKVECLKAVCDARSIQLTDGTTTVNIPRLESAYQLPTFTSIASASADGLSVANAVAHIAAQGRMETPLTLQIANGEFIATVPVLGGHAKCTVEITPKGSVPTDGILASFNRSDLLAATRDLNPSNIVSIEFTKNAVSFNQTIGLLNMTTTVGALTTCP